MISGPLTSDLSQKAPRVDLISRAANELTLISGATLAAQGFQLPSVNLRQNQNDFCGLSVLLPSHWQTYAVDLYWAVVTATAGSPKFRFSYKAVTVGTDLSSAYDGSATDFNSDAAAGQFVMVKSTIAQNIVADPTKVLWGRIMRVASPADGLAANVGVSRITLRRQS